MKIYLVLSKDTSPFSKNNNLDLPKLDFFASKTEEDALKRFNELNLIAYGYLKLVKIVEFISKDSQ